MNAREMTTALGGSWHGRYGMVRCPAHDDREPSLSISDGVTSILVKCFAGCDTAAVLSALRARFGRDNPVSIAAPEPINPSDPRVVAARKVWHDALAPEGTLVATYLERRRITLPIPKAIRFAPQLFHVKHMAPLPAMVAAVTDLDGHVTGVHQTFLDDDGNKAPVIPVKVMTGRFGNGAVRLGEPEDGVLAIAEGIETALSAMQLYGGVVWAACGSRLASVAVPPGVRVVELYADNGAPGIEAARKAALRIGAAGLEDRVLFPPGSCGDWNDALVACHGVATAGGSP